MDIAILLTGSFAIKGVLDLVFHILKIPLSFMFFMELYTPIYILMILAIIYNYPELGGLERKQI